MVGSFIELYKSGESGQKSINNSPRTSMIKLEITGSGSLEVSAQLSEKSEKYILGAIKANDFSKVVNLTQGLYTIEVSGYENIFFNLTGEATVRLKTIV